MKQKNSIGRKLQNAIVIHPALKKPKKSEKFSPEFCLQEAINLAEALEGLQVVFSQIYFITKIRPSEYIGAGQVDALKQIIDAEKVELLVVDTALTPIQQRNLEKALGIKVIDRTGLILEIFGQRAQTKEGTLQVELAALSYQRTRLVRSWTHLERQRGGFGFTGGPGETQLEIDRRLIDERIIRLKKDLEKVKRTRGLHRKSRQKVPYPIVVLVGYTNAGKSTLFNKLSGANVLAKDMLFATLDPTMRMLKLPGGTKCILSDTVGFISSLPTQLVASFRATLEEVLEADLIVHVQDSSASFAKDQAEDVYKILEDLGITAEEEHFIEVYNKADCLAQESKKALQEKLKREEGVMISALEGEGVEELLKLIEKKLLGKTPILSLKLAPQDGKALAWLHANGEVVDYIEEEESIYIKVRLSEKKKALFQKEFKSPQLIDNK